MRFCRVIWICVALIGVGCLCEASGISLISPAQAQIGDVVIRDKKWTLPENKSIYIERCEIVGTNLSQDDVNAWFDGTLTSAAASAKLKTAVAQKITMSGVVYSAALGKAQMPLIEMSQLDKGRIAHISIPNLSNVQNDGSAVQIRDIRLDGLDLLNESADEVFIPHLADGGDGEGAFALDVTGVADWKVASISLLRQASVDDRTVPPVAAFHNLQVLVPERVTIESVEIPLPEKDLAAEAKSGALSWLKTGAVELAGIDVGDKKIVTFNIPEITISPAEQTQLAAIMNTFGYNPLKLRLSVRATYGSISKVLSFNDFSLSGQQLGELRFGSNFDNIDGSPWMAQDDVSRYAAVLEFAISSASIRFDNYGLFEKFLALEAQDAGQTSAQIKTQWKDLAAQAAFSLLGNSADAIRLGHTLSDFVDNPGSISITATSKGAPLSLGEVVLGPSSLVSLLQSKVDITSWASPRE